MYKIICGQQIQLMETISKLFTLLQSKIKQFIKNHIIDERPKEYDDKENKIFIYYPNMKNEEDVLRSLIHEYTHYTQDSTLFKRYKQIYSYDEDPTEIEARKNEENWEMFSQK